MRHNNRRIKGRFFTLCGDRYEIWDRHILVSKGIVKTKWPWLHKNYKTKEFYKHWKPSFSDYVNKVL